VSKLRHERYRSGNGIASKEDAMKRLIPVLCAAGVLAALSITLFAQVQKEQPAILNFTLVNDQFCTGGQPKLEALEKLKGEGLKSILNLRTPAEHRAADEEAKAKELGLKYFNIPVVYREPKDEQVDLFLQITEDTANRPMLIHCTAAIRVGAFWMIRRVLRDGWTFEAAEEEAKKIGLREAPHLVAFARAYIEKNRKK
jgi:uncharacterized protein (TIGR01244 family)